MLERVTNFLKDVYSFKPDVWREEAKQMDTTALSSELHGRQRLLNINHNCRVIEGPVVGVAAMVIGGLDRNPGLMFAGAALVLATAIVHGRPEVSLHERVIILKEEFAARQTSNCSV